jgi:hypothetical protein
VLLQFKAEVTLRKLAKPQHFGRLNDLGENDIGGGAVAAQRCKSDRTVRCCEKTHRVDDTENADGVLNLKVEQLPAHRQRVALVDVTYEGALDQSSECVSRGAVVYTGGLRDLTQCERTVGSRQHEQHPLPETPLFLT